MQYWLPAVISFVITISTYFITKWFDNRRDGKNEKRKEKMTVFKTLMAKRGVYYDYYKVEALNSIAVIFCDSSSVIQAWNDYHNALSISDSLPEAEQKTKLTEAEDKFVRLLEMMANDLGYKDTVVWTDIKNSYMPRWIATESSARNSMNNLLIKSEKVSIPNQQISYQRKKGKN